MVNSTQPYRGVGVDEPGTGILKNYQTFDPVWIDELCFWNRTLDDQEIEDLYNSYGNNI